MTDDSIDILLVESNAAEAERLEFLLGSLPELVLRVNRVVDSAGAEAHLETHRPSLMMLGLETSRAGADKLLFGFRSRFPWLPILVVATDRDPQAAEALIRHGAQECLGQDELLPDLLARAIQHAVARHAAETGLRANEDLMRLVAENTTDLIAILDRDGRRLFNSPSYARTFGDSTELAGTDSFAEIHPEDRESVRQVFQETLRTGQGKRTEFRLQLRGGSVRWLESIGSVIRDSHGEPDRVVVVSRDLTEKRKLMEGLDRTVGELRKVHLELAETRKRLRQSEKMEATATFAGAIAHDIKNTLQTLLLGLDFLKAVLPTDDEGTKRVLQEMDSAARKTDRAMGNLLDFAGCGTPELSRQDLHALIRECIDGVTPDAEAKQVRLESQRAEQSPQILIDPVRFRHVLLHILLDSIQATPADGVVRVTTNTRAVTLAGALEPIANSGLVLIEIEDEGQFRSEATTDDAPRDPGTEPGGRGSTLDLATLRKVVEGLNGRVEVKPRAERGRRLTLMLKLESDGGSDDSDERTS